MFRKAQAGILNLPMEKLTPKQSNFTKKYLETSNATEAAMIAYKPKNRATARAIGSENLTKPNVQKAISDFLEENGLDAKLVISSLVDDIKNKPMERIAELLLASKLLGLLDRAKKEEENRERSLPIPILSAIYGGRSVSEPTEKEKEMVASAFRDLE